MKKIKHLKAPWYFGSMIVAVIIGEFAALQVARALDIRFSPIPVAAVCIGLVAATVSLLYDGTD